MKQRNLWDVACWFVMAASVALACSRAGAEPADASPPARVVPPVVDLRETLVRVPVTVKDRFGREETKPMAITIYRPPGEGVHPLVVFNHGRATPDKRASQGQYRPESVARYWVDKGFVVLVPTRVGYWETYGDFDPEDTGNCGMPGLESVSQVLAQEVLATVDFAKTLPYVDTQHWIVAGQSVGGVTTVATVAKAPPGLMAGINFAGGIGGNPDTRPGNPCSPQAIERLWGRLAATAKVPMLWFYWPNDHYWGPDNPKVWHRAWLAGGGQAEFHTFGPTGTEGHYGLDQDMDHWLPVVDAFLNQLGFTAPAIVKPPAPSGFADIADVDKVPVKASYQKAYQAFLQRPLPRAFAVSERGGYGDASGDYAVGRAMGSCRKYGFKCQLYAVDNDVVWTGFTTTPSAGVSP